MTEKEKLVIISMLIFLSILIVISCFFIYDFYIDAKCSTTNDTKWFNDNNCLKYSNVQK